VQLIGLGKAIPAPVRFTVSAVLVFPEFVFTVNVPV
jgi:hypothetical protein